MGKRSRQIRRLTRQEFLLMSAGAGAGLALAGCGGGSQNNPAVQGQGGSGGGGTEYTGPTVELAFWNGFTGGDGPFMRELVDQFSSEHENIQVSMSTQEWADYYESVPAAVRGGEGPDVGIMHSDQLGTNAARGVILPLDTVAESLGLEESDFAPEVWNAGIYNGQRFGIPLDMHPLALYYNKSLLEDAGLDPNSPPTNRDDYEAALEELKSSGIQGSWVSPFPFTGTLQFESLLWQFGGDLYDEETSKATFNSDAGVEALTWMVDLVQNDYSPRDVAQDAEFIAFQNGENAFHWNGIWQINAFKEVSDLDWGVAPLPRIGSEDAVWSGSHNFVIMQTSDQNRIDASQVFINWISQQSIEWARAGQIPARASVRESQEFADLQEQSTIAEQVPYVRFVPAVPGIGDVQPESFDQAVNEAVLLQKEPKTALDEAAQRADQILEENREKYEA
ncbi:MAG: ABC transporter, substrate-binding protein (cluster 1, maltose/g3p/polyamine/iron) [uncultured Rubrobacteraceae bacterium]|uniref:ABC transporter, substrate-binding protein (Cluster 1, maltose/g3p/polyamine/iron) n=1 Tax=uncultured Rubrobacteraceae bacterium TaxID=349277 RepID=A0A6J4R0N5_9ACTN|nr:MAG: ABC transporter, substrate-binding protein (cluster 1, maltose/g3p/polyamine/iron) [uncultured Rubrobacteraceae bacterium]